MISLRLAHRRVTSRLHTASATRGRTSASQHQHLRQKLPIMIDLKGLFPTVTAFIALVITLCCLFAGTQTNVLDSVNLLTVRPSPTYLHTSHLPTIPLHRHPGQSLQPQLTHPIPSTALHPPRKLHLAIPRLLLRPRPHLLPRHPPTVLTPTRFRLHRTNLHGLAPQHNIMLEPDDPGLLRSDRVLADGDHTGSRAGMASGYQ